MGCSGKSTDLEAGLGEEVLLAIGQSVILKGEDLSIEFVDVVEDSRCPRDVTCIWEGQAVCALKITSGESVSDLTIVEPGLSPGLSGAVFGTYDLSFTLEPYPESTLEISKDEYKLKLTCSSLTAPIDTEGDVTGFITDIQPVENGDIVGTLSVESHADKIVSKYVITVNTRTRIYRRSGEELLEASFQTFENKQWVELWFDGPVMESFPMQATAGQVVILE